MYGKISFFKRWVSNWGGLERLFVTDDLEMNGRPGHYQVMVFVVYSNLHCIRCLFLQITINKRNVPICAWPLWQSSVLFTRSMHSIHFTFWLLILVYEQPISMIKHLITYQMYMHGTLWSGDVAIKLQRFSDVIHD